MLAFIQLDTGQSGSGATYRLTLGLHVPRAPLGVPFPVTNSSVNRLLVCCAI